MRDELREQVRDRYAAAAVAVQHGQTGGCVETSSAAGAGVAAACSTDALQVDDAFGAGLYSPGQRGELPAEALLASLGCGNPVAVADLHPGERVLDLGSGGGIDVLLSARRVGLAGRAFGVDMTDEMLALAQANKTKAGVDNVEFLKGTIENIPLPADSIDVVISNCVINLSVDKPAVFAEMHRVLAPGGRIGISDVVAEDNLSPAQRAERGSYVGCVAGALTRSEYLTGLAEVGFVDASVEFTHQAVPGMHGAIVRASKPAARPTRKPEAAACCDPGEASSCCAADAKASCCGDTATAVPSSCGCR